MPKKRIAPEILAVETLARTRLFEIEAVDLRFSNGVQTRFERIKGNPGGAVLIVPMPDEQTVLLTREYATGVGRYEIGLPKGRIEKGESVLIAANREMKEEIGFGAKTLTLLSKISANPAYSGQMTYVVLAESLYPESLEGDEPEPIEVIPWPIEEIDSLIASGECTEARSLAALYMTRDILRRRHG